MISPIRLFALSAAFAAVGLLSGCSQPAAPIRSVERAPMPTGAVALPVAPPASNFEASGMPPASGVSGSAGAPVTQPPQWTAPNQAGNVQVGTYTQPSQQGMMGTADGARGAVVMSGEVREGERRLALVQACQANAMGVRDQCSLGFADTRGGREVTSQVQAYFLSTSASLAPKVTFENYCGAGWLATVMSTQGTVQGGGVLQTQAAVCGHPSAGQALTALFNACDAQTQGGCRQSTAVKVAWGYWDGLQMPGTDADIGRPYPADRFPDSQLCESRLPLQESGLCPSSAAVPLRLLGLP
ncbi:hypothetical protein [Zwartia sp.]|uniref:hypothetical protein n=1 Tax=Zwartia sp. TaxID=2978004 RepID=UPI00271E7F0D|nr:hypothetical protein [Zwartia sp.]MDO9023546.1 hypothetical protein [Zwartia sp.]